jgi:hypothetical protein
MLPFSLENLIRYDYWKLSQGATVRSNEILGGKTLAGVFV